MHDEPYINYLQLLPNELIYQLEELCRNPNNSIIGFFEYLFHHSLFFSPENHPTAEYDFASCFTMLFDSDLHDPKSRVERKFILHGLKQLLRKPINNTAELESRLKLARAYLSHQDYEYQITILAYAILKKNTAILCSHLFGIMKQSSDNSLTITSTHLMLLHVKQLIGTTRHIADDTSCLAKQLLEGFQTNTVSSYTHSTPSIICKQLVYCTLGVDTLYQLEQLLHYLFTSISNLADATNSSALTFFEVKDEVRKRLEMVNNILYSHATPMLNELLLKDIFLRLISIPSWNRNYLSNVHECLIIILMKLPSSEAAALLIKQHLITKIYDDSFSNVSPIFDELVRFICQNVEAEYILKNLVQPIKKILETMAPDTRILSYYSRLKNVLDIVLNPLSPPLTNITKTEKSEAPSKSNKPVVLRQNDELMTAQALINSTEELEYHELFYKLYKSILYNYSSIDFSHKYSKRLLEILTTNETFSDLDFLNIKEEIASACSPHCRKKYDELLQLCLSKGSLNDTDFSEFMDRLALVCTPEVFIRLYLQPYWNNRPMDWTSNENFHIYIQMTIINSAKETTTFMENTLNEFLNELAQDQHKGVPHAVLRFLLIFTCRIDPETLQHDYLSRIPESFQMVIQSLIAIKRQGEILANAAQLSLTTLALAPLELEQSIMPLAHS
jgi:hypothetical protein